MRITAALLVLSCSICTAALANDKPIEIKAGDAIPSSIIRTSHLSPFKSDMPAVLPMVVVSFQTQATEKAGNMFGPPAIQYTLKGISPELMQKIADEVQDAVEGELKAGGWQILPADKVLDVDSWKSWTKSPDPSGVEAKRSFFTVGKGTSTFSSKEMERVFVGGKRPLIGNGAVLGGWTAAPALCQIGHDMGAKVILVRAIVNFANISSGVRGFFTGQNWKGNTTLEVSYAEMDVYPPDSSGATPARLTTENAITMHSDFVSDVKKDSDGLSIVADPDRYEKDTVETIRAVAKGFVAQSSK